MKTAGAYVYVDHRGSLEAVRGLVTRQQAKKVEQTASSKGEEPAEKGLSQSLLLSLRSFRLQVAEVALASKPDLAYDLLVYGAARELIAGQSGSDGLDISFRDHIPLAAEAKDTKAARAFSAIKDRLPLKWLENIDLAEQFAAFRKLTPQQKASMLAHCVARTLVAGLAPESPDRIDAGDVALSLAGVDVAEYWRPTAENYLGRLTRDRLLGLGAELFSQRWREKWGRAKKGELAKELDRASADPKKSAANNQIEQKLRSWLPEGMVFTLPEQRTPKPKSKAA